MVCGCFGELKAETQPKVVCRTILRRIRLHLLQTCSPARQGQLVLPFCTYAPALFKVACRLAVPQAIW